MNQSGLDLPYLRAYSQSLQEQARRLLAGGGAGAQLLRRYPQSHQLRTDKALYEYTASLKSRYLRNAGIVHRVIYDSKIHVLRNALGLHTSRALVQGSKLSARNEIRVATIFKNTPEEFLRMIVVHELAHLREKDHGKAFYQLCAHMEPAYHQYEFDLRLYLSHLDAGGPRLWEQD